MRRIYDFNHCTKLLESTFWLSSKGKEVTVGGERTCKTYADRGLLWGKKLLRFVLMPEPSIKSPDVLTYRCSSPAGVLHNMLHFP